MHDYPHDVLERAVPYGVYDVTANRGFIYLGTSGDTPAFAVDAIGAWWQTDGRGYPAGTDQLLVLADAGGSNGCRVRAWKERLQVEICDRLGLTVTLCHYPTGCSKWNPIEHRLFSQISRNWAGMPPANLGDSVGSNSWHHDHDWTGNPGQLSVGTLSEGAKSQRRRYGRLECRAARHSSDLELHD